MTLLLLTPPEYRCVNKILDLETVLENKFNDKNIVGSINALHEDLWNRYKG